MEEKSVEIIIGLVKDPTFGLSIMVGVGGVYTELYQDVSFRVIPIDSYDANEMVNEIKGKKLLEGFRNIKASKEEVIDLLNQLPDDSTLEEIQYHLYVRQKIQRGLQDVDQGKVQTQEEVENRMKKWLAK